MGYRPSLEVFPEELRRVPIPEWRILLVLAYDGPSTMYQIKKKYGFKYSSIHRATKSLEKLKWIKVVERRRAQKGGTTKVHGLTLVGLLHVLYRIPKWFLPSEIYTTREEKWLLPKEVKTDVRKLRTQQDVAFHLLYCFKFNEVAENYQRLLPMIYGKWTHFKNNHVTINVFSSMVKVAHVTLAHYYSSMRSTRRGVSLRKLFADKVYYNLLKECMFERYPRKRKGYESFDYQDMIQQEAIAVFQNDPQLTALFKQICTILEKETASLSKSIRKIKTAVLSQNAPRQN